jgi:hypothetical protein
MLILIVFGNTALRRIFIPEKKQSNLTYIVYILIKIELPVLFYILYSMNTEAFV